MFLLFASPRAFYAAGGWHDFRGAFQTLNEAVQAGTALRVKEEWMDDDDFTDAKPVEWWHVVDLSTQQIVAASPQQPHGAPDLECGQCP
jgi:hypothetical protein